MQLSSRVSVLAVALLAGPWAGYAGAAPLSPAVRNPVIGGTASFDADLSSSGEIFALVEGDPSSPPVFDDPAPLLIGGSFLFNALGTPGDDLVADFIIDDVDGDFDPNNTFLSGVLEEFGYGDTLVTMIFGSLDGQAASLFGSRVLVSFFDFGALPQGAGAFSGRLSYTIQSISPIPLPLTGVLLLIGIGGLALLRTRRRAG